MARPLGALTMPRAAPIETPCIGVCVLDDASGRCEGCLRSIDEIAAWSGLAPEARAQILRDLPRRRAQAAG